MGCVVNGPAKLRHADLGVAGGKMSGSCLKTEGNKTSKRKEIIDLLKKKLLISSNFSFYKLSRQSGVNFCARNIAISSL